MGQAAATRAAAVPRAGSLAGRCSDGLVNDDDRMTYQVVADRRTQFNALVWQTPALSLTAQAFLFTISLSAGTAPTGRRIAAVLSILTATLSGLLMAKQRAREVQDAEWLEAFEKEHELRIVHGRDVHREWERAHARWWVRLTSYVVWQLGMAAFGIAGAVVLVLSVLRPGALT